MAKRMTKEEIELWEQCYDYFRYDLLGYRENQSLPRMTIFRLRGMVNGRFMDNNNIKSYGEYSFDVLLNTMKFCKSDVQRALGRISFNNEQSKIIYICAIIENNLNTVYMRMQNKKKQNEKMKNADISQSTHEGAAYQKKTESVSDKFNDLW